MSGMEPLQIMGVGMVGAFNPEGRSIPQIVIAFTILLAFLISLWLPIQDDGMKSLLVGAVGVIMGAYFNDQGTKIVKP
jgi:hypothetical protein